MNGQMMTMKNEGLKINRGTGLQFPTISDIKNLLINEGDSGVKILFVCHGNICRSAAAEMVMRHMIAQRGLERKIVCESAAATGEEIGNDVYPPMKRTLLAHGIPCPHHSARMLTRRDGEKYDMVIGMDRENLSDMRRILGDRAMDRCSLLMDHAGFPGREVEDPWYTRDFESAYRDVETGCRALLDELAGTGLT